MRSLSSGHPSDKFKHYSTIEEQKDYLKDLITHYESLIDMKPRNDLVVHFLEFIEEEMYRIKSRLRNIREKEIECIYFAKHYGGIS